MKQPVNDPTTRFEPGVQVQVDFTIVRLDHNPLLAFVATLGGSRATFVKFDACQNSSAWCNGIASALQFFGGTPRQLLFDNAKTIIIERDVYGTGKHRWRPSFCNLLKNMTLSLESVAPTEPKPKAKKTKGKVECLNHYLKSSFVVPLEATFRQAGLILDVAAANARIGDWLMTVANTRKHGTTGVPSEERMPRERAALLALPAPVPMSGQRPLPTESLPPPLAMYQSLLEVRA